MDMKRSALALLFGGFSVGVAAASFEAREPTWESEKYQSTAAELHGSGMLQEFAGSLNEAFALPHTVGLRFAECGEPNAYYDPETREISMCFELIESYYESMADEFESEDELDDAVAGAFVVVLFHELGHALIDVLDLPVTGREEDAVDQLAAWALIDNDSGDDAVLNAALSYYTSAEQSEGEFYDTDFADEHSLDKQRFFNLVCWVYGSDPDKHAALVDDETLPQARAERCPGEYARIDRSWTRLLEDAVRQ